MAHFFLSENYDFYMSLKSKYISETHVEMVDISDFLDLGN